LKHTEVTNARPTNNPASKMRASFFPTFNVLPVSASNDNRSCNVNTIQRQLKTFLFAQYWRWHPIAH